MVTNAFKREKQKEKGLTSGFVKPLVLVAGAGFEPTTSGL